MDFWFVVSNGSETWSARLREELTLRVFENRVLRGLFEPKKEEVAGGWRRLHNEELCNLYTSPSIIRVIKLKGMRWTRHAARMEEMKNVYNILVGEPKEKRSLGRHRHKEEDISMDCREIGWEVVN
jgi:hypothetical protein